MSGAYARAFEANRCLCRPFLSCGGSFVCGECKREVGWCMGGHEGNARLDEMCSDCWCKAVEK